MTKLNPEKKLTQTELDESIQRILDRLIFIRNCEDRGLEEKKLWEARNETKVWKKLREVFVYYDKNYDSKLFTCYPTDAKKVHLCDTLDIDASVMRGIIECLYRTPDKSISYDFSIIDADTLGTVYEQYLSHILKKTEKRATLTENHAPQTQKTRKGHHHQTTTPKQQKATVQKQNRTHNKPQTANNQNHTQQTTHNNTQTPETPNQTQPLPHQPKKAQNNKTILRGCR